MRYFLSVLLCVTAYPRMVSASVLFSYTINEGTSSATPDSHLSFPIQFYAFGPYTYTSGLIFSADQFGLGDVGKTVTITQDTDPNFNSFVAGLEDGIDDLMIFWSISDLGPFGSPAVESAVIWGNSSDPRIDLHGYNVESISLRLDSLSQEDTTNGSFFYPAALTLSASDTVPEPASHAGIGCGAFVLMARRRKQPVTYTRLI